MICSRCGRALTRSAVPEPVLRAGTYAALGPTCAKLVGLAAERVLPKRPRSRRSDERQLRLPA